MIEDTRPPPYTEMLKNVESANTRKEMNIMSESLFLSPEEAADLRELISQTKEANARAAEAAKNEGWTKEKIMAVKDQGKRQALIKAHMDLFKGQVHGKR